jgi:hypothetical protein
VPSDRFAASVGLGLVLAAAVAGVADHLALVAGVYASGAVFLASVAVVGILDTRRRGLTVPVGRPRDFPTAAAVAVLPGAVVLAALAVVGWVVPLSDLTGVVYAPRASVTSVLARRGLGPAAAGAGHALVACLLVHEPLRRHGASGPTLVAAVAGGALFFRALLVDAAVTLSPASVRWRFLVTGLLAAGSVAGAVLLAVLVECMRDGSVRPFYRPAYVPVYAVALFLAVASGTVLLEYPDVVVHVLWGGSAAAAAVGYERARSLWPPMVALAGVEVALTVAPVLAV